MGREKREKNGAQKVPSAELEATCRMMRKMGTEDGRKTYRKRKWIGEPPFAWISARRGESIFGSLGCSGLTRRHDRNEQSVCQGVAD